MSTHHKSLRPFQVVAILVVLAMGLMLVGTHISSAAPVRDSFVNYTGKISNDVLQTTANGQRTSFIIYLDDQADLSAAYNMEDQDARGWYVYTTLREHAASAQAPIINQLEAAGVSYTSYWGANLIVAEGDRSLVDALAARPDVKVIESNEPSDWIQDEDTPESTDEENAIEAATPGVTNINAPQLWNLGYTGQGIVVANQDTGMRWTHTAIKTKYRGWISGAADHNYNWWDAIHVQLTGDGGTASPATNPCGRNITAPCDDQGHGTHTTGTIVGDDFGVGGTGTNQIGVAPGAKWIGCRNMDSGNGRPSTYAECFQFFIAPTDLNGQNPDPTKRPHVMNNSWGCPPSELCAANTLKTIVENTQAAGIFVVASAGNDGSNCSTVQDPPAIYSSAFSVGAINGSTNALQSFSSRGPVAIDGSGRMKPDLVAPGASVRSSTRTSDTSYGNMSGTSMAGPHVVGAVALLWSARPNLVRDIPRSEYLLTRSANRAGITVANNSTGCGGITTTPNNHFGWGRVDALAAYNAEPDLYQTITFEGISGKTNGDPDFAVNAAASSGLAVSYSASGNCTISANTVHITGAGSCTVTASQAGLDVYNITAGSPAPYYPATAVSQTFSIAKATPAITWSNPAGIVLGTALSGVQLNATASVPGSFDYTPPAGAVLGVGASQILHLDFTPTDTANYTPASKEVTINVLYNFTGFFQPVDVLPTLNSVNAGQAIPLKWRITDVKGNPVTNLTNVRVTVESLSCPLGTASNQVEEYAAGNSDLKNQDNGNYRFDWKTPKTYAQSCKTLKLDLGEGPGMEHTALFQFPK